MKRLSPRRARRTLLEALETRRLLTFAVSSPLPDFTTSSSSSTVSLADHFHDPSNTNTTVLMHFQPYDPASDGGDVYVQLTDTVTPQTVANFLSYVNSGAFNNTIIHRSIPGFVIQGGGNLNDGSTLAHITQFSPVQNEFSNDLAAAGGPGSHVNVRGTIAMAKIPATDGSGNAIPGGGPDSATSEWFFNLADNSGVGTGTDGANDPLGLDFQNGGFTTFGSVSSGMGVVDGIAALTPRLVNAGPNSFPNLPLAGDGSVTYANLVTLTYATAECTYQVTTSNPSLFSSVSVVGSQLTLNYAPGHTGSSDVTVTATDFTGHAASDTFTATVPVVSAAVDGNTVTDNQTSPVSLGTPTQGATASKTIRLTNTSTGTLSFAAPTVPAGYTITSPADLTAVTLAPGDSVDVTVSSVATNTGGANAGTLAINFSSADSPTFHIPLTYTVLTRQASVSYNSSTLANNQSISVGTVGTGSPLTLTLAVRNTGTGTLSLSAPTLPAGYSVLTPLPATLAAGASANLVLSVDTSSAGAKSGTLSINSDDPNTPTLSFPVTATVVTPNLAATVDGNPVVDDQAAPVDFGSDISQETSVSKTLHLTNAGSSTIHFTGYSVPSGFIWGGPFNGTSRQPFIPDLAPGASADVTILLSTFDGGSKSGTLVLHSNDAVTPAFSIPLTGHVNFRQLAVSYNGAPLTADPTTHTTPSVTLPTTTEGAAQTLTLHVTNSGSGMDLTLLTPTLPSWLSVVTALPSTLAPGASADLVLAVDTSQGQAAAYTGTVTIKSDDPLYALDSSSFRVPVSVTINYRRLAATAAVTGATVAPGSSVNFGTVNQGDTAHFTLHLANTGNLPLTLSNPTLPAGYTLAGAFPSSLAPGASADVVLSLDTLRTRGTYSGAFTFSTDDAHTPTFSLNFSGKLLGKGIVVSLDGNAIPFGAAPTVNFGRVRQNTPGTQITFSISNSGVLPLSFQSVSIPAGYSVVSALPDSLPAGGSAQLTVALDSSNTGTFDGTLHIVSSDPDRPSFDIPLSAAVSLPVKLGAGGAPSVTFTDADGTLTTLTLKGPGSATLDFFGDNLNPVSSAKKGTTVAGSSVSLGALTLTGTSAAKSKLTITSKGGNKSFDLGDVSGSPLSSLTATTAWLVGTLTLSNTKTITLASASGATLHLGAGTSLTIPAVSNSTLTATGNLKSLKVNSWTGGSLSASSIDSLTVNGSVTGATLSATKSVGKITVKGSFASSSLRSAGKITSFSATSLNGSQVYAGLAATSNPPAEAPAWNGSAAINSLTVKSFTNSSVAARTLARLSLGTVKTHNSGTPLGVAASSINSLTAKLDTGKSLKLSGIKSAAKLTPALAKAGPLNDLEIVIA